MSCDNKNKQISCAFSNKSLILKKLNDILKYKNSQISHLCEIKEFLCKIYQELQVASQIQNISQLQCIQSNIIDRVRLFKDLSCKKCNGHKLIRDVDKLFEISLKSNSFADGGLADVLPSNVPSDLINNGVVGGCIKFENKYSSEIISIDNNESAASIARKIRGTSDNCGLSFNVIDNNQFRLSNFSLNPGDQMNLCLFIKGDGCGETIEKISITANTLKDIANQINDFESINNIKINAKYISTSCPMGDNDNFDNCNCGTTGCNTVPFLGLGPGFLTLSCNEVSYPTFNTTTPLVIIGDSIIVTVEKGYDVVINIINPAIDTHIQVNSVVQCGDRSAYAVLGNPEVITINTPPFTTSVIIVGTIYVYSSIYFNLFTTNDTIIDQHFGHNGKFDPCIIKRKFPLICNWGFFEGKAFIVSLSYKCSTKFDYTVKIPFLPISVVAEILTCLSLYDFKCENITNILASLTKFKELIDAYICSIKLSKTIVKSVKCRHDICNQKHHKSDECSESSSDDCDNEDKKHKRKNKKCKCEDPENCNC